MPINLPSPVEIISTPDGKVTTTWYQRFAEVFRIVGPASTYTPTLTNSTNLGASTATSNTRYVRSGDVVTVGGRLLADATAGAATLTELGVSFPIPSNLTLESQCAGIGAITGTGTMQSVQILGDTTNDRATFTWRSDSTGNDTLTFVFMYLVL